MARAPQLLVPHLFSLVVNNLPVEKWLLESICANPETSFCKVFNDTGQQAVLQLVTQSLKPDEAVGAMLHAARFATSGGTGDNNRFIELLGKINDGKFKGLFDVQGLGNGKPLAVCSTVPFQCTHFNVHHPVQRHGSPPR